MTGPSFRTFPTVLAGLLLAVTLVVMLAIFLVANPLTRVDHPEQALALVAATTMESDEALQLVSAAERRLVSLLSFGSDEAAQLIAWYEQLIAHSGNPVSRVQLAIVAGETGRDDLTRALLEAWRQRPEPLASFGRLIDTAYLGDGEIGRDALDALDAQQRALSSGWFSDRLILRLAEAAPWPEMAASTRQRLRARASREVLWNRLSWMLQLALLVAGVIALARWCRAPADRLAVAAAPIPPPWRASAGATVLIRGHAIGILLLIPFFALGRLVRVNETVALLLVYPLISAPVVVLARRHLIQPAGLTFREAMGWRIAPDRRRRLAWIVVGGLGAQSLADWIVSGLSGWWHLPIHWAEWFDEHLVWGRPLDAATMLVAAAVVAPVLEEIVFRGLLYATLRRRYSAAVSMAASAALFASVHGYGRVGWISTAASAVIWAWLYERTRSVVPGILAHAANNLLVCAGLLAMRL